MPEQTNEDKTQQASISEPRTLETLSVHEIFQQHYINLIIQLDDYNPRT
jgi:hypothetical protein